VTDEGPVVDSGPISLSAEGDLAANSTLQGSSAEGQQTFSIERGRHELRAADAAHRREEQRKDNELRRHREKVVFYVVVGILVAGLVVGFIVAVEADNADTRRWAQGIVTLLFGGIVGGITGYFTGRSGK
jgi:hypothetical protein